MLIMAVVTQPATDKARDALIMAVVTQPVTDKGARCANNGGSHTDYSLLFRRPIGPKAQWSENIINLTYICNLTLP